MLFVCVLCVFVWGEVNGPFNPLRVSNRHLSQSHSSSWIVLHFLSSVHSHFLYLPHNRSHTALRMMRVLLVLLMDWKGAEPQAVPQAVCFQAECWRVLVAGRGFWEGRAGAG